MLNINFVLFCWVLPSIPPLPGGGHVIKGFSLSLKMDLVEVEAFSFLHQEITCRIILEADQSHRSPLSCGVIDHIVNQFSFLAPVANQCFRTLVIRLVFNVYLSQL